MIVDAQIHVWEAHSARRPWPDPTARSHGDPLSASIVLQAMHDAGVDRAVLVPPTWDGAKNDIALAAAAAYPDTFCVMGRLPIDRPLPKSGLEHWKAQPGMHGLRFTFTHQAAAYLTNGVADWIWAEAERANLPVMVLPPGMAHHFGPIAQRHPGLRLIIDHLALPTFGLKDLAAYAELPQLLALARYDNVAVKASAQPCYSTEYYPFRNTHDYLKAVFEAFGPQRMFWGSDLSRLTCPYRQAVTMFTEELPWLSGSDKDLVMGQALCQWIDWPLPEPT